MDNYGYPISERNQDDQEQDSYQSSSSYHQTTHHTSSYSSSSYGYSSYADGAEDGTDSNDPHFTEEDYSRPNPNYPQPPESKHNPGPDPGKYSAFVL
ncbi:hypothetical protein HMPREF1544_01951 [Mucor circinelloides 1006PhL]|uniref:Uncharacterized protein n=1 Tax=Mucor circinelloides f. circinelloides (strain 1006PhL) TaxID=1220926 RepID=S2JLK5_MUCC1|nr:hypothetical protein HMPREF1544_01951 [Mucor circinelloides 1006PhL]